jgi:uncharacterized protein (TIRG00374 family)
MLVVILGVLVMAARAFADQLPAGLRALSRAEPRWIAFAILAELCSYFLISIVFRVLTGPDNMIGRWLALRTALVAFGFGNILPGAPAPGLALATVELRRRGVTLRKRNLAMAWTAWFWITGFLALAATSTIAADILGHIPAQDEIVLLTVDSSVLLVLIIAAVFAGHPWPLERAAVLFGRTRWSRHSSDDHARAAGREWHDDAMNALGGFWRRQGVAGLAALSWLADVVCLMFALRAIGVTVPFDILLVSYVVAIVASAVPFLPGGAGAVEAAVPAVLHYYGVPLEAGIAGTLAWRLVSLLLPAATGAAILALPRAVHVIQVRTGRVPAAAPTDEHPAADDERMAA